MNAIDKTRVEQTSILSLRVWNRIAMWAQHGIGIYDVLMKDTHIPTTKYRMHMWVKINIMCEKKKQVINKTT